jgi:hypothetical protein
MSEGVNTGEFSVQTEFEDKKVFTLDFKEYIDTDLVVGNDYDFNTHPSILSQADVIERTGLNLGDLVARVQLPFNNSPFISPEEGIDRSKPNQFYVFKKHEESDGSRHVPTYTVIGAEQLEAAMNGEDLADEAYMTLDTKGQAIEIGRDGWMPNNGEKYATAKDKEDAIYRRSPAVSRKHGTFHVRDDGHLHLVISPEAKAENTTKISRGPVNDAEVQEKVAKLMR